MIVLRRRYRSRKPKKPIIWASGANTIENTGGAGEAVDVGEASGGAEREAAEIEMEQLN